jgi:hypothetical protein
VFAGKQPRERSSCVFRESGLREGGELSLMLARAKWASTYGEGRERAWLKDANGQ